MAGHKDQLTAFEFKELAAKPKKKGNKYGAKRITIDGYNFDSRAEATRYGYHKIRKQQGEIKDFKMQVKYDFVYNGILIMSYKSDFNIIENDGSLTVEDVKSPITKTLASFVTKKKAMLAWYGIDVKVVIVE